MRSERVQTLGQVPWETGMTIGSGYDVRELQPARSPFESFDLEFVTDISRLEDFKLETQTIETIEDLHRAIELSAGVSAPVLCVGNVNPATQYLSEIRCNAKNIATIISCTYTWPEETNDPDDPPDLTTEASDVLERGKSGAFFSRYGQHFIAGRICQSSFHAIYTHSTARVEDMAKFKKDITQSRMNLTAATEVDQIKKYTEIAKSSRVTTRVQIFVNGVGDSIGIHASTHDVVPALKHFIETSHKPLPHIAILKHYSLAVSGVPRPSQSWLIPSDLSDSLEQLTILGIRARSHPLLDAQKITTSVADLKRDLTSIHLADPTWKEALIKFSILLQEKQHLLETCDRREKILHIMKSANPSSEWPKKWTDAGKTKEWRCGLSTSELGPLSSESRHDILTFSKPETPWPECQEESLRHEYNDRIVIGARIESLRTDGLNGSWKVVNGGVGLSHFEVRFSTTHHRWGKYSFEVWSVDKGLYGEEV